MAQKPDSFVNHLLDQLGPTGPVRARRMFGGHGIFLDGLMFALVAGDILYLKVDDENRPAFEARSLPAFSYQRQGKLCKLSYHEAPEEAMDDPVLLQDWANQSYAAALRVAAAKAEKKKKNK